MAYVVFAMLCLEVRCSNEAEKEVNHLMIAVGGIEQVYAGPLCDHQEMTVKYEEEGPHLFCESFQRRNGASVRSKSLCNCSHEIMRARSDWCTTLQIIGFAIAAGCIPALEKFREFFEILLLRIRGSDFFWILSLIQDFAHSGP